MARGQGRTGLPLPIPSPRPRPQGPPSPAAAPAACPSPAAAAPPPPRPSRTWPGCPAGGAGCRAGRAGAGARRGERAQDGTTQVGGCLGQPTGQEGGGERAGVGRGEGRPPVQMQPTRLCIPGRPTPNPQPRPSRAAPRVAGCAPPVERTPAPAVEVRQRSVALAWGVAQRQHNLQHKDSTPRRPAPDVRGSVQTLGVLEGRQVRRQQQRGVRGWGASGGYLRCRTVARGDRLTALLPHTNYCGTCPAAISRPLRANPAPKPSPAPTPPQHPPAPTPPQRTFTCSSTSTTCSYSLSGVRISRSKICGRDCTEGRGGGGKGRRLASALVVDMQGRAAARERVCVCGVPSSTLGRAVVLQAAGRQPHQSPTPRHHEQHVCVCVSTL